MQKDSKLEKSFSSIEIQGSEFLTGMFTGLDPAGIAIGAIFRATKKDMKTFTYELYSQSHALAPIKLLGLGVGVPYIYANPEIGIGIGVAMRVFDAVGNYVRRNREPQTN